MADLLQRHVAALTSGDAEATARLYAETADLVSFDGTARGRAAIARRYETFFDYHGDIASVEVLHRQQADDALLVLLAVESERGRFELVNVYLADGDHIARHFSNETRAAMDRDEVVAEVDDDLGEVPAAGAPPTPPRGGATPDGTTAER